MTENQNHPATAENTAAVSKQSNPNHQDGQVQTPIPVPDHGTKVDELKQQQPVQEKEHTPREHQHDYKTPVAEKTPGNETSNPVNKENPSEDEQKRSFPIQDHTKPDSQTPDHKL